MRVDLFTGDCIEVMRGMPDNSIDSVVTDPPYGLSERKTSKVIACLAAWLAGEPYAPKGRGFMGKTWDAWVPGPEVWRECLRLLKPGGHMLVFAGTQSMDLMSIAIRLAGFELRDAIGYAHDSGGAPLLAWVYGSGFPKSHNVANSIDKMNGAGDRGHRIATASAHHPDGTKEPNGDNLPPYRARTSEGTGWEGWGTALKPAWEPIILARKPLDGTVAENVLAYGAGALNIDGSRVPVDPYLDAPQLRTMQRGQRTNDTSGQIWGLSKLGGDEPQVVQPEGRWPANVIHDGSDEVLDAFPSAKGQQGYVGPEHGDRLSINTYSDFGPRPPTPPRGDAGSAARFFYSAKATKKDRDDGLDDGRKTEHHTPELRTTARKNYHPTVKPTKLMRYLCRLIAPPGGTVLDPFMGSGSTGRGAIIEGLNFIGIEKDADYAEIAAARIAAATDRPGKETKKKVTPSGDQLSMFEIADA